MENAEFSTLIFPLHYEELKIATILATIFFEKRYWVGTFERTDQEGYAIARHIFGAEPTNPEIHQFILDHYQDLNFGQAREFQLEIKRMNPKRVQRKVRQEMDRVKETTKPSTLAQDYMREELERHKKEKKQTSRAEKEAKKQAHFAQKQEKKKKKQKGR